ncbi:MAG: penicillin-binding protein activator, partial [Proteobacteria bacterium]|nr:penicillin-binding protein activator [Pseudomonadota bacterium]
MRLNKKLGHPARPRSTLASTITILLMLFVLSACAMPSGGMSSRSGEGRAERLAQNGEHDDAAAIYIGMASTSTAAERDRLTMLAVEQWLYAGDITRARNAFRGVTQPQGGELSWLYDSNTATFSLVNGDPDAALSLLEPLSRQPLSLEHRLRVEALRADAWVQKGDPTRAVELMIQRENWLSGSRETERNRKRLWQGLITSKPLDLRAAAERA